MGERAAAAAGTHPEQLPVRPKGILHFLGVQHLQTEIVHWAGDKHASCDSITVKEAWQMGGRRLAQQQQQL